MQQHPMQQIEKKIEEISLQHNKTTLYKAQLSVLQSLNHSRQGFHLTPQNNPKLPDNQGVRTTTHPPATRSATDPNAYFDLAW